MTFESLRISEFFFFDRNLLQCRNQCLREMRQYPTDVIIDLNFHFQVIFSCLHLTSLLESRNFLCIASEVCYLFDFHEYKNKFRPLFPGKIFLCFPKIFISIEKKDKREGLQKTAFILRR